MHSMPPQDSLPFLPDSPGLSSLSPLTHLQSLSFPFTLEFPVSASIQSNHTSLMSLAFLFNPSVYLVELDFDPPLSLAPLAPEVSGTSLLPLFLPVPVALPLLAPVLPEVVTIEDPPIPFSPFSSADCTMLNHFSFNDFVAIAFPDIAGDLDIQI